VKVLKLSEIQSDCGTQVRDSICEETVTRYSERMQEGDKFPAVHVFSDGNGFYLADGFHRIMAAQRVGFLDFHCEIHKGTIKDAMWFAMGANRENGRPMSKGDVRAAVEKALRTWPDKSQQQIADQIGCSQYLVCKVKEDIISKNNTEIPQTRTDAMGRTRPTSYKTKPEPEEVEGTETTETEVTKKPDIKKSKTIPAPIEAALNRLATEVQLCAGSGWKRCDKNELVKRIKSIIKEVQQ
jgi:hypothetical protein